MIKEFCLYLRDNRGFSKNTIGNYKRGVSLFRRYLRSEGKKIGEFDKITLRDINGFVFDQKLTKKANTVNIYIAAIRCYLYYGMGLGFNVVNPKLLLNLRFARKKIESLSEDDAKKLVEYFRNYPCTDDKIEELRKTRNYLMCVLLLYTGIRVTELVNIKIEDIGDTLIVKGKGSKYRPIKLFKDDLDLIRLYLFMRKNYHSQFLFISLSSNSRGKKLSRNSVEKIISKGAEDAGITTKVFPHKLRHTFATNLLRGKAPLIHIQKLLGHTSIETTQMYLTVLNSELEETQKILKRY